MIGIIILIICVLAMLVSFIGVLVCVGVFTDKMIDILQGGYDHED